MVQGRIQLFERRGGSYSQQNTQILFTPVLDLYSPNTRILFTPVFRPLFTKYSDIISNYHQKCKCQCSLCWQRSSNLQIILLIHSLYSNPFFIFIHNDDVLKDLHDYCVRLQQLYFDVIGYFGCLRVLRSTLKPQLFNECFVLKVNDINFYFKMYVIICWI